jgi:hypothetical protein
VVASGAKYLVAVDGPFATCAAFLPNELHGWCVTVASPMLTSASVAVVKRESPDAVLIAADAGGLLATRDASKSFKPACRLLHPSLFSGRIVHA